MTASVREQARMAQILPKRLREARELCGFSVAEACLGLPIAPRSLHAYEQEGESPRVPSAIVLGLLAGRYASRPGWFLGQSRTRRV